MNHVSGAIILIWVNYLGVSISTRKAKLLKVKISQRGPIFRFFWGVIFWYCSKGDLTLPCHIATQCNRKTYVSCTIHGLVERRDK